MRKAYGAGLYAMCGPAFDADATLALPQAMIAVMGAEAAVNAVFANKIAARPEAERAAYVEELRDPVPRRHRHRSSWPPTCTSTPWCPGDDLRGELDRRLSTLSTKVDPGYPRRRAVVPV